MKDIILIRKRLTHDLLRLRSFLSCIPGNEESVERLRGKEGEERAARIVDYIMQELGDDQTRTPVENSASQVRRAVKSSFARAKGE